jgi:hypothetical protein
MAGGAAGFAFAMACLLKFPKIRVYQSTEPFFDPPADFLTMLNITLMAEKSKRDHHY